MRKLFKTLFFGGAVLFDAGPGTQAAKLKRLLQAAAPGEMKYIIVSHSHADHPGAVKYWKAEYPDAQIVTHRLFAEVRRYFRELRLHALEELLRRNQRTTGNFSEAGWLTARIDATRNAMGRE